MDKKEGKKPCKDAPTTTANNNSKATSSRTAAQAAAEPPRDRRNLEAIRKKRKEEKDAQEQERIKRQQQRGAATTGGQFDESLKEQNELQRAIEQSLVISNTQQLHLDGSPGPSDQSQQTRSTAVGNTEDAKEMRKLEQALRRSREAHALEQSRAGDPPLKHTRPLQNKQQLSQPSRSQATQDLTQGTRATTNQSKTLVSESVINKATPSATEATLVAPRATIQPLNTEDQQRLNRIRDRLEAPAQLSQRQSSSALPSNTADVTTSSASSRNLQGTQDQLAAYQRRQHELQQHRQRPAQATYRPGDTSLSTLDTIMKPRPMNSTPFSDTVVKPRATAAGHLDDSAGPRPQAALPRTVLTGNMSQALTRILVPASAENSAVRRPDAMPSLASIVEEIPRVRGGLPEMASQAIAAQAQGTAVYPGINAGGAVRQAAESRGAAAVTQFETVVRSNLLRLCPAGFQWLNTYGGYICAGGHQFVLHASIDMWANGTLMLPGMHNAHRFSLFARNALSVHPPPVGLSLNLHRAHRMFMVQLASVGAVVDDAELCPCIWELGFSVKTTAEVEALEGTVVTLRKVFPATCLCFNA